MTLRADDGSLLQAQEPIVLNTEGEAIFDARQSQRNESQNSYGKFRVFKVGGAWSPLVVLVAGGILALGAVFIGGFLAVLLALWLIRLVLRSIGLRV